MPDFVVDSVALPGPKVLWDGASSVVAAPDMWCAHTDYNALRDAANSLRSFVKTGLVPGVYSLATLTVGANGNITGVAAGVGLTDGDKGDVVISGGGTVFTVDAGAITPAKMSNAAANSFLGNNTGAPAVPAYLTIAQSRTALGLVAIATSGSASDLSAGTVPAARMPAHTGPVTTVAGGVATTITANAITNANLAQMATNTVKANLTGGTADPSDATLATLATALASSISLQLLAAAGHFGNGSDGAVLFDGAFAVTGWTRSGTTYSPTSRPTWYFTTCTISGGVTLCMEVGGEGTGGGCSAEIYANVGFVIPSGTATIKLNGATPTSQTAATVMVQGHTGATVGQGAGGIQNAGQNGTNFAGNWFNARKNGAGGFGGASLTAAASTAGSVPLTTLADSVGLPGTWEQAKTGRLLESNPGPESGGGGGGSGAGTVGIASGGAGGNGGGVLVVGGRTVAGNLNCFAKGGNGAPGTAVAGSNAGGGSGGGGGKVTFGCGTATVPAGVTLSAAGGTGGVGSVGGSAGGAGGDGRTESYPLGIST